MLGICSFNFAAPGRLGSFGLARKAPGGTKRGSPTGNSIGKSIGNSIGNTKIYIKINKTYMLEINMGPMGPRGLGSWALWAPGAMGPKLKKIVVSV